MAGTLPTADEFFGDKDKAPDSERLPSADEFFGAPPPPSFGERLSTAIGDAFTQNPLALMAKPGLDFTAAVANDIGGMMEGGDIHSSPAMDHFFTTHPVGRVLNAFGQGAAQGWGSQSLLGTIDPDTEKFLRGAGVFNDYAKGQSDLLKSVNEAIIRPALMASSFTDPYRIGQNILAAGSAVLAGTQAGVVEAGNEADQTTLGHALDLKHLATDTAAFLESPEGMGFVSHVPHIELARARSLGVIGEGEAGYMGTKAPEPESAVARADAIKEDIASQPEPEPVSGSPESPVEVTGAPPPAPEVPEVQAPNIHTIARQLAPDTFRKYDALVTRQGTFRRWLDELAAVRDADPRIAAAQQEIDTILGKVNGVEDRLTKKAAARLDDIRSEMEDFRAADTPDMARVRKALQDNDFRMRDLAPDVAKVYRTAQERIPESAADVSRPVQEVPAGADNALGDIRGSDGDGAGPEIAVSASPAGPDAIAAAPRHVAPVDIAGEISQKLLAAGRPAEEANAAAAIVASHYEARAANLKGANAAELYARDAPDIKVGGRARARELASRTLNQRGPEWPPIKEPPAKMEGANENNNKGNVFNIGQREELNAGLYGKEAAAAYNELERRLHDKYGDGIYNKATKEEIKRLSDLDRRSILEKPDHRLPVIEGVDHKFYQGKRGSITLSDARNTIRLFKDADASTFMHETGHQWLEELMADAADARANEAVRADAATVRDWLGVKDGEPIPTKAHEKFARGFERYLMEGRAPSKALAGVFAKFKAWLTQIYQTVQRLRSPINDDIRDVFDRLVTATPEERAVIAEDAAEAKSLADTHEELAEATPPEQAAAVADKIRSEIDAHVEKEAPEIARELNPNGPRQPAAGEPRENAAPTSGGDEAGSAAGENGAPAQSGTVTAGGNKAAPESDFARAAEPEPGTVAEPTDANQRFATPESDLIDKAGNIRLDNLNSTEDVNAVLRLMAERNGDFMSARRGVVSDAQVLEFADAMGVEAREINIDRLRQISLEDDVPLAARIRAGREMLIQSAESVRAAMNGTDELAYIEASQRHLRIQETLSGITAEWGRAGRAFRMRADEAAAAQDLSGFLQQNTGRTLFQIQREMKLGRQLDTTKKVSKFLNDSRKPTFVDMLLEYWINALLSGPMTHVKNTLGNALVAANSVVETAIASGISTVLRSEDAVHLGEAKARWFGATQGAIEGLSAAKAVIKSEEAIAGAHTVETRPGAIPGTVGRAVRIPTRLLSAEDELFKAIGYRSELNVQAHVTASREGLTGGAFAARVAELTQNPSEEMMALAKKNAEYQTFTNSLGPTGRAIQNFANSHPLAKFVVPFIRTPVNILKYAGERTPLGVLSREVRDNLSGKNGTRARDTQMARMALGTTIVIAATGLAAQGLMTGGGPSDPQQRALLRATGWQPYSIKVGDMYYSYQWAEPFATIAGTVSDMSDIWHGGQQHGDDWEKIAASLVGGTAKNLLGKLSLRGISDFINAATNPVQYGGSYVESFVNSFVPGIVAQGERLVDPTLREAHTPTDALKSRIPILSETLMPRRDVWGEPIVNQGSLGPDIGNPIFESRDTKDPVNRELLADGYFPSRLDRKIRGVDLTDKQYDDYSRVAGRTAKMLLNQVVQTQGFSSMPRSIRHDIVQKTIDTAREMARNMVMIQNPDIIRKAVQAKTNQLTPQ